MVIAGADDRAVPSGDVRQGAARLDRDDVRIARDERVLGRKARAVQAGLLGAREERVGVVRPLVVAKRGERAHRERAAGEVVGRGHADLVPLDLDGRQVEDRPLARAEQVLATDMQRAGRVVREVELGSWLVAGRREGG